MTRPRPMTAEPRTVRLRDIATGAAIGIALWAFLCWLVPDAPPPETASAIRDARADAVFAYMAMVLFTGLGMCIWPAAMIDWRTGRIRP